MTLQSLNGNDSTGWTLEDTLTASGGVTGWLRATGEVGVQITGPATNVSIQVERSTRDPNNQTANAAPAGDLITGNPSTGMQPRAYMEPGVGWWRARCTALTGASVVVALNCQGEN